MKKTLTDMDKLKYWLDAEFSIVHTMLAIIFYQLITTPWLRILMIIYIAFSILYTIVRVAYLTTYDKDYLKVPKK